MIRHACVQGSPEWLRLRLGIPSASNFHRILTPAKLQLSAGRKQYQIELLTEMILCRPLDEVNTAAMQSGKHFEPHAVAAYEAVTGMETVESGFTTTDDGRVGCSEDRFVGDVGLAEFKCSFTPQNHVARMLYPKEFAAEHWLQVQGQLWINSDRQWCDLVGYCPDTGMDVVIERIYPSEKFARHGNRRSRHSSRSWMIW